MVDQIDCSEANKEFRDKPGEPAYPREMLLRIGLDECYLMVDCLLLIERRTRTDIFLICTLAGMQKPVYRDNFIRFKLDYT